MKTMKKVLTLFLVSVMLFSMLPLDGVFAATTYTVTLKCGPEGTGSTKTLTKTAGQNLSLQYTNSGIKSAYGMAPSTGGSGFGAQRVFIEWNTEVNANGKGVGKAYRNVYNVDADVTLYAVWGFEIQYNADGGKFPSTGNSVFLKYVADCDDNDYQNPKTLYGNFDFPEGANAPTKAGCKRVTMSSGADFFGLLYPDMSFFTTETAEQNLTIPPTGGKMPWSSFHITTSAHGNPAVEFYAIWEPSVTYDPNGGSGNSYSEYLDWDWGPLHYYRSYYIDSNSFSKAGTYFVGWNTKPDGSGTSYSVGQNVGGQRSDSDPITLYAQWADGSTGEADKYTMTFDVNGGYMMAGTTYQIEYGQTFGDAMGISVPTPYRSGYNFLGWYCKEYNYWLNPADQMGAKEDITFVAQWESSVPTYNLVFNPNGGKMPIGYSTTYTFRENQSFNEVIGNFPVPAYAGYIFEGWMLSTDPSVVWKDSFGDQTFTYGKAVTLIAQWTEDPNYVPPPEPHNLTFIVNGGTMPSGFKTAYVVYDNASIVDSIGGFPVPTRAGFIFGGWMLQSDNSVIWKDSFGDQTYTYGADIKLIALWTKDPNYVPPPEPRNVTFDVNGGTMPSGYNTAYVVYDNASINDSIGGFPVPTRVGYIFDGWQLSLDSTVVWTDSFGDQVYTYGADATLTALWSKDPNYVPPATPFTLTFNSNGGAIDGTLTYSIYVGQTYKSVISSTPKVVRDGYKFMGWLCSGTDYILDLSDTFIYETNVTFKAQWEAVDPNGTFIMTFDPNGGTMPSNYSTTYEFKLYQKFVDVIGGFPTPTKAGCTFNGWIREDWPNDHHWTDSFGSQPYTFGHDVTLVAVWIENCSHNLYQSGYAAPGCNVDGYTEYTCSKCGAIKTDVIAATGHNYDSGVVTKQPTCTAKGTRTYTCKNDSSHSYTITIDALGHQYTEAVKINETAPECEKAGGYDMAVYCGRCNAELEKTHYTTPATGHTYGDWSVYKEASVSEAGEERRYCSNGCGSYESREIPAIIAPVAVPEVSVNGKIVSISGADDITELAYAKGTFTSYADIENADDCTFIGSGYITSNTVNGVFSTEVSETGSYTFYTLMSDGHEYFLHVNIEEEVVEPEEPEVKTSVTVDAVTLTVNGLSSDVKDFFIAKGIYTTYRQVNENKITRITAAKIGTLSEYSYNVPGSGEYTVCVRYNDNTLEFHYPVVDVVEPTFTTNGLQLTINNLEGIKVVRTAPGSLTSVSAIKRTEGNRAFTAKYITNKAAYMVQYRANGTYTVAVCYENGYTVITQIEITMKTPVFAQDGNTVTFTSLDGLKVVRYAKGEYTTSSQIKSAAGSVAITASKVVDDKLSVTLKSAGTYTFCVQYDDESYNYYTVIAE